MKVTQKLMLQMGRAKDSENVPEMRKKIYGALMEFLMSEFDIQGDLYEADSQEWNENYHDAVEDVWNMLYHLQHGAEPRYPVKKRDLWRN